MRRLQVLLVSLMFCLGHAIAKPLNGLVTVDDGLNFNNTENISDDYVRLTLTAPSYQRANAIKMAVEEWLGPEMVRLESDTMVLIQAPRDSSARIEFIAALLALDIP